MSRLSVAMLLHKSVVYDSRVQREASALADFGHDVTVIELDRSATGIMRGFRRVSAAPPPWVRRALPFALYRAAFLASFVHRVVALRPDVVHAHDAAMLLPGLIGARLTGARLVYDSHELATGVPYRRGAWAWFVRTIERIAVPRCAAVITVSDGIAERLQALYGLRRRPAVVRNVTELEPPGAPTGVLRRHLCIGDAPLVLHQGAPAPDRGCEVLIRALAEVPDAHVAFLGSSPFAGYEDGLLALAGACGVSERVHFVASVPLAELLTWTADADIGVSLLQDTCENHRLALPNKVFEYLAAGVPVVVSDLPEMTDLVCRHGVGWAIRADDDTTLAEALRRALAARAAASLGERLRTAARELSWDAERGRLRTVYEVVRQRGDPRAVILVRNTVSHDARVAREVDTLRRGGWEPVVVGVVSNDVRERHGRVGGAPLLRLMPKSSPTRQKRTST